MKSMFKRSILSTLLMIPAIIGYSQTTTHEVQPGETLVSICAKYGVSEQQLTEANPNLKKYIYTGMRLSIPSVRGESKKGQNNPASIAASKQEKATTTMERNTSNVFPKNAQQPADNTIGNNVDHCIDFNAQYKREDGINSFGVSIGAGGSESGVYITDVFALGVGSNDYLKDYYSFMACLGIGAHKRFIGKGFLFQFQAFPYIGYASTSYKDKYNSKETKTEHDKFSYGFMLNPEIGIKMLTTAKNNDIYLTGGYRMGAEEFKFKGFFDNGVWHVGITLVVK